VAGSLDGPAWSVPAVVAHRDRIGGWRGDDRSARPVISRLTISIHGRQVAQWQVLQERHETPVPWSRSTAPPGQGTGASPAMPASSRQLWKSR